MMPVSSLQPCICALKHPKATLLTLNAGPCRGVLLLPVLPACTGADPGLFCMRQMVMVAGRRRCSMLHAPCSTLHAPSCDSQSFFLPTYRPAHWSPPLLSCSLHLYHSAFPVRDVPSSCSPPVQYAIHVLVQYSGQTDSPHLC